LTAPLEPSRGTAWLPTTPEGEAALQVYETEDDAAAAALESVGCDETTIYEMTEEPTWWRDELYGEWEPGFLLGCISTGIVFPTIPIGAAVLLDLLWPDEWGPAPPT
jgi:hypothetical protein